MRYNKVAIVTYSVGGKHGIRAMDVRCAPMLLFKTVSG